MDQDRQDAQNWANEWSIRNKNKKTIIAIVAILIGVLIFIGLKYVSIMVSRTTYGDTTDMRESMQGRYVYDEYQEIVIDGDTVYLTYYDVREYDPNSDDNQYNPFTGSYLDSTYDDKVTKWDYKKGVIETSWLGDLIVDTDMNIIYNERTFKKTDGEHVRAEEQTTAPANEATESGESADAIATEETAAPAETEQFFDETQQAAEEAGEEPIEGEEPPLE